MKKFIPVALVAFIVPQMVMAAWWNPFSWGIFHRAERANEVREINYERKTTSAATTTPKPAEAKPALVNSCAEISNTTFRSKNMYESGHGTDGILMGYWSIMFGDKDFNWSYSDVVESGTFSCSGGKLEATGFSRSIATSYNHGILIWDGKEYEKDAGITAVSKSDPELPSVKPYISTQKGSYPLNVMFSVPLLKGYNYDGVYYTIAFGDGEAAGFNKCTTTCPPVVNQSHTYKTAGIYQAVITVRTECGASECLGKSKEVARFDIQVGPLLTQ